MKTKRIVAILITVIAILAILFCYRYQVLKHRFPNPVNESYGVGKPMTDGNFTVTLQKSELVDGDEIEQLAPGVSFEPYKGKAVRMVLAHVRVEKSKKCDDTYNFTKIAAESGAWSNGILREAFMKLNKGISIQKAEIAYHHYIDVILPFSMVSAMYKSSDWKKIDSRSFSLVFSMYPVKKYMVVHG